MASFVIEGGRKLEGEIKIQGSKNGSLPLLSASLLAEGKTVLYGCPDLSDVRAALNILTYLGCETAFDKGVAVIDCSNAKRSNIPDDMMQEMRSTSLCPIALPMAIRTMTKCPVCWMQR